MTDLVFIEKKHTFAFEKSARLKEDASPLFYYLPIMQHD